MSTTRHLSAALLALACTQGMVQAQVLRCTDAQGHVTYTNGSCPHSKQIKEVLPQASVQERAEQEAEYQEALARRRAEQQAWAVRDAAQQQADAARAAAAAAQRPPPAPVVVPVPTQGPAPMPSYGPFYPARPPHVRPPPPPPQPRPGGEGYNCNVFRCYDGKGNTWNRP